MKINVALLTHNEPEETERVLAQLVACRPGVVQVLDDFSIQPFSDKLQWLCEKKYGFGFAQRHLDRNFGLDGIRDYNFSDQRNACLDLLPKDEWVMTLDADEMLSLPSFFKQASDQMEAAPDVDCWDIVRRNTVVREDRNDVSEEVHRRFFRNDGKVRWVGAVHEQPMGWTKVGLITGCHIEHVKTAAKCAVQNQFYHDQFYSRGIGL